MSYTQHGLACVFHCVFVQPETLISSYTLQHLLMKQVLSSTMPVTSNALLTEIQCYRSVTNRCSVLCSGPLFILIVKSVLSVKLPWSFPCISPSSPSLQTRTDSIPPSYTPFPLTFPVCFFFLGSRREWWSLSVLRPVWLRQNKITCDIDGRADAPECLFSDTGVLQCIVGLDSMHVPMNCLIRLDMTSLWSLSLCFSS